MAGRAAFGLRHGDLDLGAVDRLVEAQRDLGFQVAATLAARLRPAAALARKLAIPADDAVALLRKLLGPQPAGETKE